MEQELARLRSDVKAARFLLNRDHERLVECERRNGVRSIEDIKAVCGEEYWRWRNAGTFLAESQERLRRAEERRHRIQEVAY